jgi:hypothetical protein
VPENTPAGSYTIVYQICDKLNPTNCDSNGNGECGALSIDATNDTINVANGTTGDDDAGNVLA